MSDYDAIIKRMNDLTLRARNREITWEKYRRKWNRINRNDYYYLQIMFRVLGKGLAESNVNETCQTCGFTTTFKVTVESDLKLLPFEPKYRKVSMENKKVCPKCGMLGIPHVERGYTRFYHYRQGKRKVCYIGKTS